MFHACSTGNDRARRFGYREIKVPSAPIFFNTVYRHVVLLDKDKEIKIKTVYCHVASTWNLDVVAYIIHAYLYT